MRGLSYVTRREMNDSGLYSAQKSFPKILSTRNYFLTPFSGHFWGAISTSHYHILHTLAHHPKSSPALCVASQPLTAAGSPKHSSNTRIRVTSLLQVSLETSLYHRSLLIIYHVPSITHTFHGGKHRHIL
jgi:hypothetical protein